LKARFAPRSFLYDNDSFSPDAIAAIVFSSGSTGSPKGVMLSHHNIISNLESMRMVVHPTENDCICGILPFFHSFGYTVTLWFPLLHGYPAVYHSNPLDAATIGDLVHTYHATHLLATPSFLANFIRRVPAEKFRSLKIVIAGAEKLKSSLAEAFEQKFRVRPLEGYGVTEMSPVISLNMPDITADGLTQIGNKEGSAGQPLPGIAVKTINPDSGLPTDTHTPGLLLVKGPNIMRGYLNNPEKTAEVIVDGWYNTGDIGLVDEDGFVTITDRLSRFSKIAGEMVPHIAVEDIIYEGLHTTERVLAVSSVPDTHRGEKLVVLFTKNAGSESELKHIVDSSSLPNLWKPASDAYAIVDTIPLLGSGKLDLKSLHQIALDIFS
jgi:acyl-[acyl-carrier-protein]-phospholipid O-acyltransferase/long-chain-fatty-acid--[acyl-carrier-protein] ligase